VSSSSSLTLPGVTSLPPILRDVMAGAVSTAMVSAVLNPMDVLKTRRQVGNATSRTAWAEALHVAKLQGPWRGLWRPGLTASMVRELLYSGCTKGLYPVARDFVTPPGEEPTLARRAAAAALTGLGGSVCANGPDVVKIRLFAEPNRYRGFFHALGDIAGREGLQGLFVRGVSASAPRGAAIAIGEVTTYDHTKATLRKHWPAAAAGAGEPFSLHVVTSLIIGVVATTVAAPFDTLNSRVMADDEDVIRGASSTPLRSLSKRRALWLSFGVGGLLIAAWARTPS